MRAFIYLAICVLFGVATPALAHHLNVFAWADGDNIVVRCNFGSKRPALNADVKVFEGASRKLITQGATNEQGEFTFTLPEPLQNGLLIEADAGQGHKGEWKMDASELNSGASRSGGAEAKQLPARKEAPALASSASGIRSLTREELKALIAESIAPLSRQLADLHADKPRISEIIGGIGWIMGLAGITFYFMARKKK